MTLLRRLFKRESREFIHDPRPYNTRRLIERA